jgi:hypothetical protein
MSMECGECERDLRGGHDRECSRHPINRANPKRVQAALDSMRETLTWDDPPPTDVRMALALLAADDALRVIKTDPAMPVFVSEQSLDIPGRGTVHVGLFPQGCEGVNTYVMVDGKVRKIASIEYVRTNMGGLRPYDRVGLVFYAEPSE